MFFLNNIMDLIDQKVVALKRGEQMHNLKH